MFVSPDTVFTKEMLEQMTGSLRGAPMYMPSPEPAQRPRPIAVAAVKMAQIAPRSPTVALDVLGQQRFEILDALGLSGEKRSIARRLKTMDEREIDELVYANADLAKATVDRLLEEADAADRPTTLWAEPVDVARLIGATLLFADRYLVRDPVMAEVFDGRLRPERLAPALAQLARLRPLIEAGVIVPVPEEVAVAATDRLTMEVTEADLRRPELVVWVQSQIVVDGPTARSVIFLAARDDLGRGPGLFFVHGLIDPASVGKDGTFAMHALHPYDPSFDYEPWIAQCRRQGAAKLIQEMNRELTIAAAFGGHFVTRAPFRARYLQRRLGEVDAPGATVWADVPLLPELAPKDLAPILRLDETVEALRREMRRAFRHVDGSDPDRAYNAAVDLVEDLEAATVELEAEIRRKRAWNLLLPGGVSSGSVALAAATGSWGFASALLGAAAGIAGYGEHVQGRRRNAAFAFVLARRRLGRPTRGRVKANR